MTPVDNENHPDPQFFNFTMVQRWYAFSRNRTWNVELGSCPGLVTCGQSPLRCWAVSCGSQAASSQGQTTHPLTLILHPSPMLFFDFGKVLDTLRIVLTLIVVNTILSYRLCGRGFCPPGGWWECCGHIEGWPG